MKLFFLSDIHGSAHYLKQALDRFETEQAEWLILLGDELYHGARNPLPEGYDPKETAALLNAYAHKIIAVRGNCDSEVDQMVLDFPIRSDYSVVLHETKRLFLTHGHLFHPDSLPPLSAGDVFFFGHTHIPLIERKDGILLINPGSITLPKEQNPHTYGVLTDSLFEIKCLDGTVFRSATID